MRDDGMTISPLRVRLLYEGTWTEYTIPAFHCGQWAVHKEAAMRSCGYTVTHVPSGLALPTKGEPFDFEVAIGLAKRLSSISECADPTDREWLSAVKTAFYEHLNWGMCKPSKEIHQ